MCPGAWAEGGGGEGVGTAHADPPEPLPAPHVTLPLKGLAGKTENKRSKDTTWREMLQRSQDEASVTFSLVGRCYMKNMPSWQNSCFDYPSRKISALSRQTVSRETDNW